MTTKVNHIEHELAESSKVQAIREAYKTLAFMPMVLDDSDLDTKEMRVYLHLLRRAGASDKAWPSYQSIGDHCFAHDSDSPGTRKKWALAAVKCLAARNMITKTERVGSTGQQSSNLYHITAPQEWIIGGHPTVGGHSTVTRGVTPQSPPGSDSTVTPPVTPQSPKGTKEEGTTVEGTKEKVGFSGKSDLPLDFRNGGTPYVRRNRRDQTRLGVLVDNVEKHIPIKEFRVLVDAYADATDQREIVDADTDTASKALHDVQDCVLTLVQQGLRTVEEVKALCADFTANNDWYSGIPSANMMTKHYQKMKGRETDDQASREEEKQREEDKYAAAFEQYGGNEPLQLAPEGAEPSELMQRARANRAAIDGTVPEQGDG